MKAKLKKLWEGKKIGPFFIVWTIFAFYLYQIHFKETVNDINGTMMAFSYKYGFISRGLIGSIYQLVDAIFPVNMLSYESLVGFTTVITWIYFVILFWFFFTALKRCKFETNEEIKYLIIFFSIWAVPMFVSKYNFGRLDIYCFAFSLIAAVLLMKGKAEWLVVPLSALGVMVHQGNVFMFLNIILVLLVYKALSNEGKLRKKYLILFFLSGFVASVLFLYFEFFSHMNGENIFEEVVAYATAVCKNGKYHVDVVDKEILGIDLSDREVEFRWRNLVQFPIFIIFMLPYIYITIRFFKNIIRKAATKLDKFKYLFVSIGAATIIPDLLLKCDFGRWMFAIIAYYMVVTIALIAMGDEIVEGEMKHLFKTINEKIPCAIILLIYPILFQPLSDVSICALVSDIANQLNEAFFHLW